MTKHEHDTAGDLDRDAIAKDFDEAVNMTDSELENWLKSDESKAVGWKRRAAQSPSVITRVG